MSMSTYVYGFTDPSEKTYAKYKKIYDLCMKENVQLPEEVEEYFDYENPENKLQVELPVTEWDDGDMSSGFELNVADIPEGVHKIRFEISF